MGKTIEQCTADHMKGVVQDLTTKLAAVACAAQKEEINLVDLQSLTILLFRLTAAAEDAHDLCVMTQRSIKNRDKRKAGVTNG